MPSSTIVSNEVAALETGGQLIAWTTGTVAWGASAQSALAATYNDQGQYALQSYSLTYATEALGNIVQAVVIDENDSAAEWQTLASQFTNLSNLNVFSLMEDLATSAPQAQDLVASLLTNPLGDDVALTSDALLAINAGGEGMLDALIDQAHGLNAQTMLAQMGGQGCTNTMQFIALNTTPRKLGYFDTYISGLRSY